MAKVESRLLLLMSVGAINIGSLMNASPVELNRSRHMASVRSRNTTPELTVRKALFALGFRFRLHRKELPGTPDIILPRHRTVIFVHGCFWHRHANCAKTTNPKTRADFWQDKFRANIARDQRNLDGLHALGWRTLVVWECETKDSKLLRTMLCEALPSG